VLAVHLLAVDRVLVLPHTHRKMASVESDETVHDRILEEYGVDTRSLEFHTNNDQIGALRHDLERIRHHPLLPEGLPVAGAIYDVDTGKVHPVHAGACVRRAHSAGRYLRARPETHEAPEWLLGSDGLVSSRGAPWLTAPTTPSTAAVCSWNWAIPSTPPGSSNQFSRTNPKAAPCWN